MAKDKTNQGGQFSFTQGQQGNVAQDAGEKYPLLQWYNGKPNKNLPKDDPRVTGGFFYKVEDEGEKFPVGQKVTVTYGNDESAEAYAIGAAMLAVIAERVDWYTGDKNKRPTWHAQYEADRGMKGRNRFLVYLRGAEKWHEENGPMMISLYGVNGLLLARAFRDFRSTVHKAAERLAGGVQLDAYTFFASIEPDERQKASKDFDSMITPPKLGLVVDGVKFNKADPKAFLEASFIGPKGMATCAKFWAEAQEWRKVAVTDEAIAASGLEPAVDEDGGQSGAFQIGEEEA